MDFLSGSIVAGGGIAIIVAILVSIASKTGQGPTVRDRILSSSALSPMLIIHYFLPYGLAVLVMFSDIMSQLPQGIFGLAIAIGLFVINWTVGYRTPEEALLISDLCEIPGLKNWSSSFVPQSLLFVTTIVSYLAMFITISTTKTFNAQASSVVDINAVVSGGGNVSVPELITSSGVTNVSPSPVTRIGASWGLAVSVILIQLFGILSTPGCLTDSLTIGGLILPPSVRAILAVLIGAGVGVGSAYGFANSSITQPSYGIASQQAGQIILPGTTPTTQARGPGFVRERFQLGSGLGELPMPPQGGQAPIDIAKSSGAVTPGESSDQFVCEAYKNGQLVTSTLVG